MFEGLHASIAVWLKGKGEKHGKAGVCGFNVLCIVEGESDRWIL